MTIGVVELQYAPPVPCRRNVLRFVISLSIAAITTAVGWLWGQEVWQHVQLLHYQRQCLSHVAPTEQLVFDTDVAHRVKYGSLEAYEAGAPPQPFSTVGASGSVESAWTAFETVRSGAPFADATVFIHARRACAGSEQRLVVVEVHYLSLMCFGPQAMFKATALDPASLFSGATETNPAGNKYLHELDHFYEPGERLQLFAGQPDPDDASHFTIQYTRRPRRADYDLVGTIDGWLKPDGRVILEINRKPLRLRRANALR